MNGVKADLLEASPIKVEDGSADISDETTVEDSGDSSELPSLSRPYGPKILSCSECDKTFATRFGLKCHYDSHHLGIKYFCSACKKSARTRSDLNQHIKSVHLGLKHQCPHCDHLSTRTSDLGRHIRSTHLGIRYPCPNCSYVATQERCLKLHIKHKHLGIRVACPSCPYRASSSSALGVHIRTRHMLITKKSSAKASGDSEEWSHCSLDICEKDLNKHEVVHVLHCAHCRYRTKYSEELRKHIKYTHPDVLGPPKSRRKSKSELIDSQPIASKAHQVHDSQESVDQLCILCGYLANSLYDLIDHVRDQHQEGESK